MNQILILEALKTLMAVLKRPTNIAVLVALIGWFVMWTLFTRQGVEFRIEKRELWEVIQKKDSLIKEEREYYLNIIIGLKRDILECQKSQDRLKQEIKRLKQKSQ